MVCVDKALVVIPTYNERENIERLTRAILAQGEAFDVLIIDDRSPDGTGAIADRLAAETPRVKAIHRDGKLGLGTAELSGMRYAIEHDYRTVITMDADFSHDPKYLNGLAAGIGEYDLMMGSRYVPGGGVAGWGWRRRTMSRAANFLSRLILGLPQRDSSSGYKAYRVEMLRKLDLDRVFATGYAFQEEMVFRCWKAGFRIGEYPIVFEDRRVGKSKINLGEGVKLLWTLLKLRWKGP